MGHGGDCVAVRGIVLRSEGQGARAEANGDIVEFHPWDAEYDWVVDKLGHEHGELFLVFVNR